MDEALKAVDMYEHRKKAPHLLSGGQKQRIAIAGAFAMKPDCIVFDEPTAMLDPKGRRDVMAIIDRLHKEGITVILITHFMEEAVKADRMIVMEKGMIALDGRPGEIFRQDREKLKELDLEMPRFIEFAERLRNRGINISEDITDAEGLVEEICRYR